MRTVGVLTEVALDLYGAFGYTEMLAAAFYNRRGYSHSACLQFL